MTAAGIFQRYITCKLDWPRREVRGRAGQGICGSSLSLDKARERMEHRQRCARVATGQGNSVGIHAALSTERLRQQLLVTAGPPVVSSSRVSSAEIATGRCLQVHPQPTICAAQKCLQQRLGHWLWHIHRQYTVQMVSSADSHWSQQVRPLHVLHRECPCSHSG